MADQTDTEPESDKTATEDTPPKEEQPSTSEDKPKGEDDKDKPKESEDQPGGSGDKPEDKDKKPEDEAMTIKEWLKDKTRKMMATPYRREVVGCTLLLLLTLEVFRELNYIAIPLYLYRPFRKINEIFRCWRKVMKSC